MKFPVEQILNLPEMEVLDFQELEGEEIIITIEKRVAHQILVTNQKNYEKFPPNTLIKRLYGKSVLTNTGDNWKYQRLLMNEVFSKKRITGFHEIFVLYSEKLAAKWNVYIDKSGEKVELNIYPELLTLFLDIIGKAAISHDFGALAGKADEFLESLKYILSQSTRPTYQFINWWQYLPLSSNRRLQKSFETVDYFLNELIHRRRETIKETNSDADNLLDLLLQTTHFVEQDLLSLTDKEIRDNLLAIIVNGHETVATSVSITLYLLARHPQKLARVQAEIDQVMEHGKGRLTEFGLLELNYLDCVIKESLRLCPPMAGLQRVSVKEDILEGWSIPSGQAVGITLMPLHWNSQYFGENAEQFLPERYLEKTTETDFVNPKLVEASYSKCPMQKWFTHVMDSREKKADVCSPLTFGDGSRKCLGEHFAIYEMKVVLTVLLHRFNFELSPNFDIDLELGKFGLFISLFPQGGVEMLISYRQHCLHHQTADCSYSYM